MAKTWKDSKSKKQEHIKDQRKHKMTPYDRNKDRK